MGLFDTIEVMNNSPYGPSKDEYQTTDLDSLMDTYILQDSKLYKRIIEYEPVPEEERKHPILGCIRSKFLGISEYKYTGHITMYSSTSTWVLKFVNGNLIENKMTEYFAADPDNNSTHYGDGDCEGSESDYLEDEEEYYFNPQEYK